MIPGIFTFLFLLLPAALLWLIERQRWAKKMGTIVLCYTAGIILGNLGLIPNSVASVQTTLSEVSIALALPMLLFTLNIRQWSAMAGKAMLSLVFATASVVTIASTFYFLYADNNSLQSSHLAAMSVGVYTGGTPNLAAIKSGLDIPNDLYLLFHSFDTVLGAIYMLFMVSVAIPLFRRILPAPDTYNSHSSSLAEQAQELESHDENYSPLLKKSNLKQMGKISALSILALGLSAGGAELSKALFDLESTGAITILLLTSFGIIFSLSSNVRALDLAYKMGMYLILVFCVVVASMADLKNLADFDAMVAIFLFGTVIGSLVLHALLCKLAKVDSDTFMVTSVSAICSPPFVPMMVKALKNPNVLLSGMTTGIIGLALGNYLGISLALFLQSLN
ncbi:MAG: putative membrane protein [Pseudoalteromonas tetraodonis]